MSVTVREKTVVLVMEGRAVPLPPELLPEDLTPEVAAQVMSGQAVRRAAWAGTSKTGTGRKSGSTGRKGKPSAKKKVAAT